MERWAGKVAIVTGASSGIGEAIAEALVNIGMQVVGFARRVDLIESHAKRLENSPNTQNNRGKLYGIKCDMTNEEDILNAFSWTTKNIGPIHVLINNAGVFHATNLVDGDSTKWRQMIDTNFLGLCIATREACKIMMANDIQGQIIHINSITGQYHMYRPKLVLYGATKHAVTNLTDVLRQELVAKQSQIKVTSISPGIVRTDIVKDITTISPEILALFEESPVLEIEDVVAAILYVLSTGPSVHVNEITLRATGSKC